MTTIYSKTFNPGQLTGNSGDQLAWLVHPWELVSINIIGIEVAVYQGSPDYILIGNGSSPDIMLMVGKGQGGGKNWLPDGLSFSLPASSAPEPNHLDAHVSFPSGMGYQFFTTLYYTKNAQ